MCALSSPAAKRAKLKHPGKLEGLTTLGEAGGEALGQVGVADALLRGLHVIRDAVIGDLPGAGIEEGEGGAPVAVARLAHGAGIDEVGACGVDLDQLAFGAERNAPTNYNFALQRVTVHYLRDSPLRASSFRSLGGAENTFANESFMDELAAAAKVDAIEFRLRYLNDPRTQEVIRTAASRAGVRSRVIFSSARRG